MAARLETDRRTVVDVRRDDAAFEPFAPAPSRIGRFLRFAVVGASGLGVNQAALWLGTAAGGLHYAFSAILATQISTGWNFAFTEGWVFRAGREGRLRRLVLFALMNDAWLLARIPIMFALTEWFGMHYLASNLVALLASTLLRFAISDGWIWGREHPVHAYDIHGIVRISSAAALPELARFRVARLSGPADIDLEISNRGFGGPRLRPLVDRTGDTVTYVEQLGRFGFAMRVDLGTTVAIQASGLLRRSPHVLYTNVVEPVLRWLFVRKGHALVHSACLEIDGRGVLITAETDTGKTTTCLRSIRNQRARFVSDDMTIVSPEGVALAYPKPLTISHHTLAAVRGASLPLWRRTLLHVQSALHSRSGRRAGMALRRWNLPLATMNALVQMMIPPPKFHVDELLPEAEIVRSVVPGHLVVIERGQDDIRQLDLDLAAATLMSNTEDAYGFPPYDLIADALSQGFGAREAQLQRNLLRGLTVTRIRNRDRDWFRYLPELARSGGSPKPRVIRLPLRTEPAVAHT